MAFHGYLHRILDPDSSGLSRAAKRAALMVIQGGICALCGAPLPPVADHDHDTGFLRGLLCRSCNIRTGRGFGQWTKAERAYITYPPALGFHWLWDLPEWWDADDTETCWQAGMTIADYVLAMPPGEIGRRSGILSPAENDRRRNRNLAYHIAAGNITYPAGGRR